MLISYLAFFSKYFYGLQKLLNTFTHLNKLYMISILLNNYITGFVYGFYTC